MYIGKLRATINTPPTSYFGQLFQLGDTATAPTDDNRSSLYSINKDIWDIKYKKTFKIGSSETSNPNYVSNNDYKALQYFRVDLAKWLPKKIKYNDGVTVSSNCGLYAWFTIANYNDQIITGAYQPQVQFVALNNLYFTD
jgi:hypothetical protein